MSAENNINSFIFSKAYIDGKWVSAQSGSSFAVLNPADGSQITTVPDMDGRDTRLAINAAEKAQKNWAHLTAKQRSQYLLRWADIIEKNINSLAFLLTTEQGKTLSQSESEVRSSINYIRWFAHEALRINGEVLPASRNSHFEYTLKLPVGVVGAITPWNFPNSMIARKVAPALAAGCAVIIKPAEDTPLSALALAKLAAQADFPNGVLNVVTAKNGHAVGAELCANPIVRKLSFTGSTAVGKLLYEQCAPTVKKLSLELGGNAPFIVFEDADIDLAVEGALGMKFYNSGQACISVNRLFAHESIYEEFIEKLSERLQHFTLGIGTNKNVTHGPLINPKALEKVAEIVSTATKEGAQIRTGGYHRTDLGPNFFDFTILTEVTPDMKIFNTEIFGPVVPVYKFSTDDEVLALANDTTYGLAAYFYTKNTSRTFRFSRELDYGMVGVNTINFVSETMPFGGVKESGLGREGAQQGIEEYLETHYVCIQNKV